MSKAIPPQSSELELSLFGPGIGECAVVHLGSGKWMVVDSCWNESRTKAIALEYLEGLGVDVRSQIALVVVTHWHDDHIRGISQIVRHAESARFVCSAALECKDFLALVLADASIQFVEQSSGTSEFAEVLRILQSRGGGRHTRGPDHWAEAGMRLYVSGDTRCVEVWALSPSAQTVTDGKGGIAKLLPTEGAVIRRMHCPETNDLSVVLMVHSPGIGFLLGADLENAGDSWRGWQAIVRSDVRPKGRCSAYKVAHHGSENADSDDIWSELLTCQPYALLTPYARGSKQLPSQADVARLKGRTEHLYCTAWPPTASPQSRNPAVERQLREMQVRNHRALRRVPGHIRLRIPINADNSGVSLERFDGAVKL